MKWFLLVLLLDGCFYIKAKEDGFKKKNVPDYVIEPLYYKSIPGEEETIADYTYWNLKNIERVLYIDGNYTFTKDMDNTYMRILRAFYSSKSNSKFEKMPFRLPEAALCDYLNTSYRKYIEPNFKGKTNFPTLPPEGLCPVPKGSYWAKNVIIKEELMPLHVPRGLWQVQDLFYRTIPTRSMVGGVEVFLRTYDRYG